MTTPPPTPSPLANDQLLREVPEVDGWKVLAPAVLYAKIGQGGMGAVYRGKHLELEIDVAVKCLKPSLVADDPQFEARFRREARLAAELTHENLVRLYELRRAHGLSYLILELVEGETARDRVLRKGALREEEAAAIALAASRGLAKAHRHPEVIVHRDIKPENILISKRGEVKLADLGIAKAMESGDDNTFTTQGSIGTPAYMAPEQWDDQKRPSPQTDVWAMGVTLYFLLTGRNAMRGATSHQIYNEVVNREFPDPRVVRPDLSDGIVRILQRCTQKEPEKRYADASALAQDLQDFLGARNPSLQDDETGSVKATVPLLSPPPEHALKRIRAASQGIETNAPPPKRAKSSAGQPPKESVESKRGGWSSKKLFAVGAAGTLALLAVVAFVMNRMGDVDPRDSSGTPSSAQRTPTDGPNAKSTAALVGAGFTAATQVEFVPPLREGALHTRQLSLALTGRVSDASSAATVKLTRGGRATDYPLDAEGRFTIDLGLRKDTEEKLELSVSDRAPFELRIVQDSTPPKIEVVAPEPTARRTPADQCSVRLRIDDAHLARAEAGSVALVRQPDGIWTADRIELAAGNNEILLVAEDEAGNRATSRLMVERDSVGPALELSQPAAGSALESGSTLTVELTFGERLSRAAIGDQPAKIDGRVATASVTVPSGEGAWELAWSAEDELGNAAVAPLQLQRAPRRVPRIVLALPKPEGGALFEGVLYTRDTKFVVRGQVENATGTAIQVVVDGKKANYSLSETGAIEVDALLPRDKRARIDLNHGSGEALATVTVEVVQDGQDPVVTLVKPEGTKRRVRADAFDLVVQVADANLESVLLGNRRLELGADGLWVAESVGLAQEGANAFTVTARDRAGRTGAALVEVVRDTTSPQRTGVQPAESADLEAEANATVRLSFDEDLATATLDGAAMTVSGKDATRTLAVAAGEGALTWRWEATDLAGNSAKGSVAYARKTKPKVRVPEGWEIVDATPGFGTWAKKAREPKSGILFVLVAPGTFQMGSPSGEEGHQSDETQHPVTLTKAFYLAETETTQEQYKRVIGTDPSTFKGATLPVESVDWNQSRQFCQTIGCDLPTEAQWEYACRSGTTTPFSFGPTISASEVNYDANSTYGNGSKGQYRKQTTAAKSFPANAWGLFDMHGNVWEWCVDAGPVEYKSLPAQDPVQLEGASRVLRGGSWNGDPVGCRSAGRHSDSPAYRGTSVGFRVARILP